MQTRCHVSNEYASDDDDDDNRSRDGVTAAAGHKRGERKKALKYKSETRERTTEAALIFRPAKLLPHHLFYSDRAIYTLQISE